MESMDIAARNPILFAGDSVAGTDVDMASTAHAIGGDMREDRREDFIRSAHCIDPADQPLLLVVIQNRFGGSLIHSQA